MRKKIPMQHLVEKILNSCTGSQQKKFFLIAQIIIPFAFMSSAEVFLQEDADDNPKLTELSQPLESQVGVNYQSLLFFQLN